MVTWKSRDESHMVYLHNNSIRKSILLLNLIIIAFLITSL